MRHLELLVEEHSAVELLSTLLPRLLTGRATWDIKDFSGKHDLLRQLPNRLAGYRAMLDALDLRVIVLVDRDNDQCEELKARLEEVARDAGLPTKSTAAEFVVVNRIAVEELEAWYFGDADALRSVYARLPSGFERGAKYRDPDAIAGGTWEALERLLQHHGYERGGLRKTALAAQIGPYMTIETNRSVSFRHFIDAVRAAAA